MRRAFAALGVAVVFALPAFAQEAGSLFVREAIGAKTYAAAPRLAERAAMVPATLLPASETSIPDAITAIQNWNAGGRQPMRNGFRRMLPDVIDMRLSSAIAAKNGITTFENGQWTGATPGGLLRGEQRL